MKNLFSGLLFLLAFASQVDAQIYNPVKWETSSEQINTTEYDLIIKATIESG